MRVKTWGIATALIAMTALAGCSASTAPTTEESSASQQSEGSSSASSAETDSSGDCPALKQGDTIDGSVLGACVTEKTADVAGFAAKTTISGMETTTLYNPTEKEIETVTPVGSLISVGGQIYVKSATGDWQNSDPDSSDPIIASLSSSGEEFLSTDPLSTAATLTGTFTVTGTSTRLDQEVTVLSGTVGTADATADVTYELNSDYAPLAMTTTAQVSGQSVTTTMEITEWDKKQDIVAPM